MIGSRMDLLNNRTELYTAVGVAVGLFVLLRTAEKRPRPTVPIVGNWWLFGYWTGFKALLKSREYLEEGYRKYKDRVFQIPGIYLSTYYVNSPELITEVRRAPDSVLSFWAELEDGNQMRHTFSPSLASQPWHFSLIHKSLSSSRVDSLLPELCEEIEWAFEKVLDLPGEGGKVVGFYDMILEVVVRVNNRMLVGMPLCRDDAYTKYTCEFAERVAMAGLPLTLVPTWLKPLAAWFLRARIPVRDGEKWLKPLIEDRLKANVEEGLEPDDFLQWLIDAAPAAQKDPHELAVRMLTLNLASTHTSAMPFTRTFYELILHPEYIEPLREEAELTIKDNGWTKEGVGAMIKLDSFFKEAMRHKGIGLTSLMRRSLQPFHLSDGTLIPAGSAVAANAWAVHHDPAIYPEPEKFDGFRFSKMIEQGENAQHWSWWTARNDYLVWGHGAHVCAGRHYATQVLKAAMAYMLLNYDFKLPEGAKRPREEVCISVAIVPEMRGKIEFSRRKR